MSCPDCFKGAVHTHAEAEGQTETLHGTTCYVASPPPTSTSTSTSTIIYLTDFFGLDLINTKLLADQLARETGARVLVPDVIPGGGAPISMIAYAERMMTPVDTWDVLGQLKRVVAAFSPVLFSIVLVIFRAMTSAAPKRAYPVTILPFARAVRAALPPGAKLGVVGFCWGGYGSVTLCKETAVEGGTERLVDAQFCGHPYALKTPVDVVEAVRAHKVAFSMAIGDEDSWLHKDAVLETEAALRQELGPSAEGVRDGDFHYEITIYPGCTHGFVVRAKPGNAIEMAAADTARAQAVKWLKLYL